MENYATPFEHEFAVLRLEVSVKAKNGLDFILAASAVWVAITGVWLLPGPVAQKGLITFFVGPLTLPLAWLLSRLLRTNWKLPHNPLQPLGLWLNIAQLFYFPFLIFIFSKYPAYFIMTYGIITGAHFFPYAWFYNTRAYAVLAGVISVGCLVIGLRTAGPTLYLVPAFVAAMLLVLAGLLYWAYCRQRAAYTQLSPGQLAAA
ncbi:hypothetical protein FY528_08180 [Hymenobacter lutimineralis]|uniref:Uncharacterized protein n=1 Tax=Hymenobacter lutimineralis TaxID=2606448 RepID=A0A5D6V6Y7_9BACT|nr:MULTISPECIES: hypothetical protein [Hymenobacter]QIX62828.1 hypothetical protein HER32_17270 [Hymenobacter sp. BT18]TYZ11017.1 hypothetical protein FY528_08180 [Hymenobacter lutimineralis]